MTAGMHLQVLRQSPERLEPQVCVCSCMSAAHHRSAASTCVVKQQDLCMPCAQLPPFSDDASHI